MREKEEERSNKNKFMRITRPASKANNLAEMPDINSAVALEPLMLRIDSLMAKVLKRRIAGRPNSGSDTILLGD